MTPRPIAALAHAGEHFACARLSARVSAATCVARQRAARLARTPQQQGADAYASCRGCGDGARVAERVAATTQEER